MSWASSAYAVEQTRETTYLIARSFIVSRRPHSSLITIMVASSSLYQPLRLRLVLRLLLGKLFQFSQGSQGVFSLRQSQSKESSSGQLTVIDSRTSRRYQIPIANNAVQAVDIGRIFIGDEFNYSERVNNALKVLDPGFSNTAVMTSSVTFVYVSAPRCIDWTA